MGKTIRELRSQHDYTQAELAAHLGTSKLTVIRWEKGVHKPSYDHLKELGRVFGVSLSSIRLLRGSAKEIVPNATIYCRAESDTADAAETLKMQETSCRMYVDRQQYYLVDVIRETTSPGQPLWDRPQLQPLRESVVTESIDVVVCHKLEVLTRDELELGLLYDEARNNKVRIETSSGGPMATHRAELDRFVDDHAQSIYSLRKSHASSRGRLNRVRSGKPLASKFPPYGYRWRDEEKTGLIIDPETAPVVERIFEEAEIGLTLRQIAKSLTEDEISTPSGKSKAWQGGTVHKILHNPAYMGEAYGWYSGNRGARRVDGHRTGIRLPESAVPAIVSESTWESVQEQLRHNWGRIHRLRRAGVRI